ncbi:MAG: coproporphyrinogen dehydrogenase HemZ [Clostridia bacterium]
MEIVTIGHDAENAVRQIMQLFFSLDDNIKVESSLEHNKAKATIFSSGKTYDGYAVASCDEKLYITNAIKKSVFYAAKQLSDMPTPWGISTGIRPAKNVNRLKEAGFDEKYIINHLKEEYLMEDNKVSLSMFVAEKERHIIDNMYSDGVSLYVGIPFCPSRCSYCSFISQATEHNNKFITPYTDALLTEIEYTGKRLKEINRRVESVYFGGGTPTAIDVDLLKKIILKIGECFDLSHVKEFCVEAGRPDTFSKEMMDMLVKNGVDRISINPQSMHRKTLDTVGRRHSVEDIYKAFYLAREAGIKSINADLIAGLPGEDEYMMEYSLKKILQEKPNSVTIHTLYMKRASYMIDEFSTLRFAKNTAKMVDESSKILTHEGFEPYYMYKQRNTLGNLENVSYAQKGHECIYNVYIMEEVQPIIALGAGGSTKMVKGDVIERVYNPKDASDYTKRIKEVIQRKDAFFEFYKK